MAKMNIVSTGIRVAKGASKEEARKQVCEYLKKEYKEFSRVSLKANEKGKVKVAYHCGKKMQLMKITLLYGWEGQNEYDEYFYNPCSCE
jgi:hypothetical protein